MKQLVIAATVIIAFVFIFGGKKKETPTPNNNPLPPDKDPGDGSGSGSGNGTIPPPPVTTNRTIAELMASTDAISDAEAMTLSKEFWDTRKTWLTATGTAKTDLYNYYMKIHARLNSVGYDNYGKKIVAADYTNGTHSGPAAFDGRISFSGKIVRTINDLN